MSWDLYNFKNKESDRTSRDRDQSLTYKSGTEKSKVKQAKNEMFKKLTKITAFLKSYTGKANKEQEPVEETTEEKVCGSVEEEHIHEKK